MRRASWLVLVATAALAAPVADACLNSHSQEIRLLVASGHRDMALQSIANLERNYATKQSVKLTNDLAVARILFGRHDEAVTLLQDLEKRQPGHAATAANLGTAFELQGNDSAALQWIREGVRRNSREHRGTEWVHVRILEAKLAIKKDPRWLESNTVMGMRFGDGPAPLEPAPIVDYLGKTRSLQDTRFALEYQLLERIALVAAPDPVVADLLMTTAELQFWFYQSDDTNRKKAEHAKRIEKQYEQAGQYGYPRKQHIERRLEELRRQETARASVRTP